MWYSEKGNRALNFFIGCLLIILIILTVSACSSDDPSGNTSTNFRIKSIRQEVDFSDQIREYFFEYNNMGFISKITEDTEVMNLTYNDNNQILSNGRYTYTYNDKGDIVYIADQYGENITISYSENAEMQTIEIAYPGESTIQVVTFTYNSNGQIVETFCYFIDNGIQVYTSFKNYFTYDENNNITSLINEQYDEDANLITQLETTYTYASSISPNELIKNHLNLENNISLLKFIEIPIDNGIYLDAFGHSLYMPNSNIEKIESTANYSHIANYEYDATNNYPVYVKSTFNTPGGAQQVHERYWEYEKY